MAEYVLKDELFNKDTVTELADSVKAVHESFESENFIGESLDGFDTRELKERMTYMCELLENYLPEDFYQSTKIMLEACRKSDKTEGFVYGSFCEYVERNGCTDEYVMHSLEMLGEYTKSFSAEFAIRAFINKYPEETFEKMMSWAQSKEMDKRRLASEGLRAKLPWGGGISFDPLRASEPLEYLYYDEERYVVRSVANHLNDLSKIDAKAVIQKLERWKESGKQNEKEMEYLINHSLRTLIKRGNPEALSLLGYKKNPKIEVKGFQILTPELKLGEYLELEFEVLAKEDSNLMIDYIIDYPMKNGRSKKVFKLKKCEIKKGEVQKYTKRQQFKIRTTRKLYEGEHRVRLQINGSVFAESKFLLNTL